MSDKSTCEHHWVYLSKSDMYEYGYRKWQHDETFYCDKCLARQTVEVPHVDKTVSRY